jgi:predicted nuclease of predicted toxin-antitoxin system
MAVRFKIDEDLPTEVAEALRSAGHDAITVHEQHLSRTKDDQLWPIVQEERRCLVTADKGFANAQLRPPGTTCGIVLLRLPRESREGYVKLIQAFIASERVETSTRVITVVSPDSLRIHRG